MTDLLPREIIVTELPDGVRYTCRAARTWECIRSLLGLGGLLGIALLVDAANRAYRQVVLTVANDRLMVRRYGLYGTRHEEWPRLRIAYGQSK
jgi:hypothetical protein